MALAILMVEKNIDRVPNVGKVISFSLRGSAMVKVPDVFQGFGTLPMKTNQSCKHNIVYRVLNM